MKPEEITSWQNSSLKRLRNAVNDDELCFIEGPKLLEEAMAAQMELEFVVINRTDLVQHEKVMNDPRLNSVRKLIINENLFNRLSETVTSQGIIACGRIPESKTPSEGMKRIIVCDSLQDPGNLGAIIRSALAFSLEGIFLLPRCANPFSSKVIRSSMGAVFHLPVFQVELEQLTSFLKETQIPLIGLEPTANESIAQFDAEAAALVIGNEGHGFSDNVYSRLQRKLVINLDSRAESLNAAVAASIAMYELFGRKLKGAVDG
jgi:TrmH family RNA methyltransferase